MIHKRAGLYLAPLNTMLMLQIQTRCTISPDVRNSAEANLLIKCSNLQSRSRTKSG